ncbi:hypothetical protein AVEN_226362-1 [Araneus ventricosus]|uniref:Uncharacterized protein n=1 Tax=Araneus ventricosus TaxID=182803 RepID=A0A4Y2KX23_ARAVE|nr:hypothetical protein AVEN_226362-1 [Araneus ventricosus]
MRSLMLLCAFCLFAIVQGQLIYRDKIKNYYKCWTHMNCISDGSMARKMESCLDFLKPREKVLELYLEHLQENYHKFRNHTVPGALSEYCDTDGDEQDYVTPMGSGGLARLPACPMASGPLKQKTIWAPQKVWQRSKEELLLQNT